MINPWSLYLAPREFGVAAILRTPRQEVSVESATQAQIDLSVEEPVGHMWVSINILVLSEILCNS